MTTPTQKQNLGELSRTIVHEAEQEWATLVEIVVWRGPPDKPRSGKRRHVEFTADQYYGNKGYGAPMSDAEIRCAIENLLRVK
jgi:hypothetical protein